MCSTGKLNAYGLVLLLLHLVWYRYLYVLVCACMCKCSSSAVHNIPLEVEVWVLSWLKCCRVRFCVTKITMRCAGTLVRSINRSSHMLWLWEHARYASSRATDCSLQAWHLAPCLTPLPWYCLIPTEGTCTCPSAFYGLLALVRNYLSQRTSGDGSLRRRQLQNNDITY